jgi:hypothetical protein
VIKRILFACLASFSYLTIAMACPAATSTSDPKFCDSFKLAAQCHCTSSGLPARMCSDMNTLYSRMLVIFKTVQKACEFQNETSAQNCMDGWSCYRNGGLNSQNELCNGTGAPCA